MVTLEQGIKQWADSRWPTRTLASRLRKLGEEVGELAEAVCERERESVWADGWPTEDEPAARLHAAREAADCAIILSDICSMLGYSLSAVMREKFAEVQHAPTNSERRGGVVETGPRLNKCFRNGRPDASDWCDQHPLRSDCEHATSEGSCTLEGDR